MKIMKIRKPNSDLRGVINEDRLDPHSVTVEANKLKIVYRNEKDLRTLRLLIETPIPSHLMNGEVFKTFKLRDFESISVSRYMGYTTFKCRKITFEDQDGDAFSLEVI